MIDRAMQRTLFLVLCLFIDLAQVHVVHGEQVVKQVTEALSTSTSDVVSQDDLDTSFATVYGSTTSTPITVWDPLVTQMANEESSNEGSALNSPTMDENLTSSRQSFPSSSTTETSWDDFTSQLVNIESKDEEESALTSPSLDQNSTLSIQSMFSEFELASPSSSTTELMPTLTDYDGYESIFNCDIANFEYTSYSHNINVSWEGCGDTYTVKLAKAIYDKTEIPRIRWLNESSMCTFERLEECTAYNISIIPGEWDGNVYEATIRTSPGQVEHMQSLVRNDTISLTWKLPQNRNCDTFQVRLNGNIQTQSRANVFNASYDQKRCTEIDVALVDPNNNTGNLITREVPGLVNDMQATFDEYSIEVSWTAPDDDSCVHGYHVRLNEDEPQLITETHYSITDLEACTQYTVGVAAVSDTDTGEFTEKTGSTETPSGIRAVRNLRAEFSEDIIRTTWEPPDFQSACITGYGVKAWDDDRDVLIEATATNTNYDFTPVIWCMHYNIMVIPRITVKEGVPTTVTTMVSARETNPPTVTSVQPDSTTTTINLRLDSYTTNMCHISYTIVNCTASGDDLPPWVIEEKDVEQPHLDPKSRQVRILLEDLSEFTNYDCYAYVINEKGESNRSHIQFQTKQGVPSPPQNLTYEEDENGILATWEKPYKVPGNQGDYAISLHPNESLHYIPDECNIFPVIIADETHDLQYRFSDILPHHVYFIYVAASTDAGFGEPSWIRIETLPRRSGPPRDVTVVIDNLLGDTYNATLQATWHLPCDINGKLAYFTWGLQGHSLEDDAFDSHSGKIDPNPEDHVTLYTLTIPNIKPLFNYTITITAHTGDEGDEVEGEEHRQSFNSPDGFSSEPDNLQVKVLSSESANISWYEPLNKNGEILSYQINIRVNGPKHYIPNGCTLDYEEEYTYRVESDRLFYIFAEGLPNFHYEVFVSAETAPGFGMNGSTEFITLSQAPESPRDVTVTINNTLGTTYNALVEITWKLPCNTNGYLSHFKWELNLTSFEDEKDETLYGIIEPNEDENYEKLFNKLQARTSCVFSLTPYVDDGRISGESSITPFVMPDGWSSPPTDIRIENLTADSGMLTWGEPSNKNGMIHSYRVDGMIHGPVHLIPEDCDIEFGQPFNTTVDSQTFSAQLDVRPNFNYTATVAARTDADYGYQGEITFIAPPAQSEEPRNVNLTIHNEFNETFYDVSCLITWFTPCNSNGILKYFSLIVRRTSLEDPSNFSSETITIGFSQTEAYYYKIISDLLPLNTYGLLLTPVAEDGDNEIIGENYTAEFESPDGWPTAPLNLRVEGVKPETGNILWDEPANKNGLIKEYKLIMVTTGPNYVLPEGCSINYEEVLYNTTVDPSMREYVFQGISNFLYEVSVAASTRNSYGPESLLSFKTTANPPATLTNIRNEITHKKTEDYVSYINISFDKPCDLNDNFVSYVIEIVGKRQDFQDHKHIFDITDYKSNYFSLDLQPEYSYSGQILVLTESGRSTATIANFIAAAGVPSRNTRTLDAPTLTPTTATFEFDNQFFDRSQGDIIYYAIIINVGSQVSDEFGENYDFWEPAIWPNSGYWFGNAGNEEYQATPEFWNPFHENSRTINYTYVIGTGNCSVNSTVYCNGPLKPEIGYAVRLRGFTATAYRDTASIFFVTPSDQWYLPLILGLVLGILTAAVLLIFIFLLWRRRRKKEVDNVEQVVMVDETMPPRIPKHKFVEHCLMFEDNRNQLKAEYSHLDRLSAAEKPTSNIAMADNNKKKNRYINIMPYDDTRVKLTTDSNDNYEDYINASYIKGYSARAEYIATQGPMESTIQDFWRMIMQENVGIIVMVAQFVEQSKQKCYKYFPENEEIMTVGKDINVKCVSEANLNDYVIRTLIVERDDEQKVIRHLQYMLWPDFGCPTNTSSMLEFRDMVRKHVENTKNKAVVHCSAGVGRTGTLIAIDILLQNIDNSDDDIDVFGTVLDLRRQRTHMVQTEKQYEYIHKCIRDYLIKPKPTTEENNLGPIYENVNIINGYADIKGSNFGQSSTENLIRLKKL